MEEAERAAGVLARALEAAKGGAGGSCGGARCAECHSKKRRCGVSVEDADEEKGDGTVAVVLGIPDVAQAIASHVEQEDVLAFALACKGFLAGVRNAGRRLQSPVGATLSTVARAKWALPFQPLLGLEANNGKVCVSVVRSGGSEMIPVLDVAYERGLDVLSKDVMRAAARSGRVEVLDWAEKKGWEISYSNISPLLEAAAGGGSLEFVRRVWAEMERDEQGALELLGDYGDCAVQAAAGGGHQEVLAWLLDKGCEWDYNLFVSAAKGGHLALMRWAHEEHGLEFESEVLVHDFGFDPRGDGEGASLGAFTCEAAALAGHLDVLQWARGAGCPWNWQVHRNAAAGGNLEVMKWAWEQGLPFETREELARWEGGGQRRNGTSDTAALRVLNGVRTGAATEGAPSRLGMDNAFDVLGFTLSRGCPEGKYPAMIVLASQVPEEKFIPVMSRLRALDPPCPWEVGVCNLAAMGGNIEALKWLRSQDPPCPWGEGTCSSAAEQGRIEALQWLRSQDPPCPWDSNTVLGARERGWEEVEAWALEHGCPSE